MFLLGHAPGGDSRAGALSEYLASVMDKWSAVNYGCHMDYPRELKRAAEGVRRARDTAAEAEAKRDDVIRAAYRDGRLTVRGIAEHVDVSHQRVAAIVGADGVPGPATLHEAMRAALTQLGGGWVRATELADTINARGTYTRRDGGPLGTNQVRARAAKYPTMFETSSDGTGRIRLR
jgi:hypothetical protein